MKTVLFVPGFREDLFSRDYQKMIEGIESRGYKVEFIPIQWNRKTLTHWVEEFNEIYKKYDSREVILAGFSYGAMTVFISAASRNPSELWLFSLSPYFSDDMPKMKKAWLCEIGSSRADTFRKLDFESFANKLHCKTLAFVGEEEVRKYPLLGTRADAVKKYVKSSTLIVIPGMDHDVADDTYIKSVMAII